MLSFCFPAGFWILFLATLLPRLFLREFLYNGFGSDFFYKDDGTIWYQFFFAILLEIIVIWGIFRVLEKIFKTSPKPFMKRLSTRIAYWTGIGFVAVSLLTFVDVRLGLSC